MTGKISAMASDDAWEVPGYSTVRELGSGASGRVVEALDHSTSTPVAIKYLDEQLHTDQGFREAFRSEAELLSGLHSAYVVRLYRYVEAPAGAAIVMELVHGASLRAVLREQGATVPETALVVLKGSLLGLAAAHSSGVVHRDYKPENVLVTPEGHSKLADFGIAVHAGEATNVVGTPAYMAPEQWQGGPASPSTDIYAATATFFECLTGSKPFTGETIAELAVQHTTAEIPETAVPEPMRPLIRRGMAKSPDQRPLDAHCFVTELDQVAQAAYGSDWEDRGKRALSAVMALLPLTLPRHVSVVGGGSTDFAVTPLQGRPRPTRPVSGPRRIPGWAAGTAGALVIATGAVVTVAAAGGGSDSQKSGPHFARSTVAPSASHSSSGSASSSPPITSPTSTLSGTADATTGGSNGGKSNGPMGTGDAGGTLGTGGSGATGAGEPTGATAGTTSGAPGTSGSPTSDGSSGATSGSTADGPTSSPDEESSPPIPPVHVSFLGLTDMAAIQGRRAEVGLLVTTDTTSPISVTVTWYDASAGSTASNPGHQDGPSQTFTLSGKTRYQLAAEHTFDQQQCSRRWGALLSSQPQAERARPYRHIPSAAC
ncbi:protein kinase [Streptomyces sp. NPDC015127]|uniref:serine/threonine-protein kinase n=1 Tax=Streptomyces sp. NPDC015127 TaxID=3364939 RepID=UPI0037036379